MNWTLDGYNTTDAQTAEDVMATLTFVKNHSIRLVLQNTGHDYLGRSASPNALALRTSNMMNLEFQSTFEANKCSAANGVNIGVIGAGIQAQEAVAFFLQYGMMVTTGGCPSVGIAGGFGQAGGHGPLAPSFGLMVDQAVEFDVITPDGQLRTINSCNDRDLFWAMRGGGGQSFAILLNYKFKLHPSMGFATWHFQANLSASALVPNITQRTVLGGVITALANNQTMWTKNNVSGYDILNPDAVEFLEILPGNNALSKIQELTADLSSFLSSNTGLEVGANEYRTCDGTRARAKSSATWVK
jgi:FAD/FMN-containing dehydrogenase